jgi:hypothetical protein
MISFKQYLLEAKQIGTFRNPHIDTTPNEAHDIYSKYKHEDLSKESLKKEKKFKPEHLEQINHYKRQHVNLNLFHRNKDKFIKKNKNEKEYKDIEKHKRNVLTDTKHMDHVTSGKTTKDMHVYRGFGKFNIHTLKSGDIIHDKGYSSTSIDRNQAKFFSVAKQHSIKKSDENPYGLFKPIAHIHIPKGTKGHYLDHGTDSNRLHEYEREFLLHRGTHFKVLHHSYNPTTREHIVHMTVHKQDNHE